MREFGQWLHPVDWGIDCQWYIYQMEELLTTPTQAYHHFFAEITTTVHPSDMPWISPRLKRLVKQCNRAFYIDKTRFNRLCNKVLRGIRTAPLKYSNLRKLASSGGKAKLMCVGCANTHPSSLIPADTRARRQQPASLTTSQPYLKVYPSLTHPSCLPTSPPISHPEFMSIRSQINFQVLN